METQKIQILDGKDNTIVEEFNAMMSILINGGLKLSDAMSLAIDIAEKRRII